MTSIAIVIINWKQSQLTQKTLDSLLKIKTPDFKYHLYLLNSQISKEEHLKLKKTYQKTPVSFYHNQDNLGFTGANNYLLSKYDLNSYDYTLFLNNDVKLDPNFLVKLLEVATANPSYGILGPKIYFYPGYEYHQDRYQKSELGKVIWSVGGHIDWKNIYGSNIGIDQVDKGQFDKINTNIDFISGCALLIKKELLLKLKGFDNRYYLYLEDADLCQRAKRLGYQLAYVPQSVLWHLNSGSSSAASNLHDYFLTRNRILFARKFSNLRVRLALLKQSLNILLSSPSKWQKIGIKDAYLNIWNRGSWQN